VLLEDGVDGQQMEMYVQVEASTEALGKRNGTRLRTGDAREALGGARDLLGESATQGGEDVRLGGGQTAELEGEARDPLAHRRVGKEPSTC
jgi:hypothetical protein